MLGTYYYRGDSQAIL